MGAERIERRRFLKAAAGAAAFGLAATRRPAVRPGTRPNILFIMADDHATTAISCYGSRLAAVARTGNIDRIAAQGARALNCFCTNSICVPSRATILTGQYSHVNGVYSLADELDPRRPHVAKILQQAGYQTAVIGKWHLKSEPAGFDYWNILPGQGRYHDPIMKERTGDRKRRTARPLEISAELAELWLAEPPGFEDRPSPRQRLFGELFAEARRFGGRIHRGFSTDVITDLSLRWLEQRDRRRPFLLMTHFKSAHAPWDFAERHAGLYADVEIPEPESLWEDKSHRSPGSREYGFTVSGTQLERMQKKNYPTGQLDTAGMTRTQKTKAAYQKYLKDYLRCVAAIDENLGRLLDYLDAQNLEENTVVIYTSDQGLFLGEHDYIDKRWMYEESLRMPLLVRYPLEIKPGSVNDDIIINADLAPTILDYAGQPRPSWMQGASFRQNLRGRTPADWRTSMYYRYWQHCSRPAHYGIRTKRYKLIFFYGLPLGIKGAQNAPTKPGWELYDLRLDPHELNNVYEHPAYRKVVKTLKAELLEKKKQLADTDEKYPELLKLVEQYW